MTAFTRALPLFGLLLCFPACTEEAASQPDGPSALAPADEPVLAAAAEPAAEAEPAAPMIYAGRSDLGTDELDDPVPPADVDPRDPALVPDTTPDENAVAFFAMRKGKHDGIPVGGVGPHGIHLDSLVIGRGFSNSRCEAEADEFSVDEDDRVNACMRVVHGGHTEDPVTVKWTRDGHGPKATRVSLHNGHAWRTRAWLPIRHYSKGQWHVEVTAADGSVLGEADFVVR